MHQNMEHHNRPNSGMFLWCELRPTPCFDDGNVVAEVVLW